ncbi:MAG: TVP38/TMEM64 family protein [Schwartzia sp.]|nr:TVP38/TMEM64 family protein [Schwartzia sp. (in: firmicutes)]
MRLKSEGTVQLVAGLLLLALFGVIYWLCPSFFSELWRIATCGDLEETIRYIHSFGAWGMVVSFLVDVLINALGFLPSIFISTANGVLFGVVPGIIISWLAETTGVILSFLLMRTVLRDSAEKLIRKSPYLSKLDEFSGKEGFKLMLIARTIPYFPSGILTALGAVSRISVRDYALSNLIGKFPSTALEVIIGHDIVRLREHMVRLTLVVVAATLVYGGLWYLQRRKGTQAPEDLPAEGEKSLPEREKQ